MSSQINKDYQKDFIVKCDRCNYEIQVENVLASDNQLLNQFLSEKGWTIKSTKTIAGWNTKRICPKCSKKDRLEEY